MSTIPQIFPEDDNSAVPSANAIPVVGSTTTTRVSPNIQVVQGFKIDHPGTEYLRQRGCTPAAMERLGIKLITHAEADDHLQMQPEDKMRSFYKNAPAIWIPTRDMENRSHVIHGEAIYLSTKGKAPYKRHSKTSDLFPNEVSYLLNGSASDGTPLFWCESVLKANIAYECGYNAIAMNGVFGFGARQSLYVPSLRSLSPNFIHILLTDSLNIRNPRSMQNVLVAQAKWRLMVRDLYKTADLPRFVELPPPPSDWPKGDWGLDDLYMTRGRETVIKLLAAPRVFNENDSVSTWMRVLNSRYVYVEATSNIYDTVEQRHINRTDFFNNLLPQKCDDKPVAPIWFGSVGRRQVRATIFRPGEPEVVDGCLNVWTGFDVQPVKGDDSVKKYWVDTIYESFGDEGRHLIEQFAGLVQTPGRRFPRHIFIGGRQGTGKNFVVEPLMRIYGPKHAMPWELLNITNPFNVLQQYCRIALLNELGDPSTYPAALKTSLTSLLKKNADPNERQHAITAKGRDSVMFDRLQFDIILSNYGYPADLMSDDRRLLALRSSDHMGIQSAGTRGTKPVEWWQERWNWLNNENGAAEVLAYLLAYDISGVDFEGPAPVTLYKSQLIEHARGSGATLASMMHEFGMNPMAVIRDVLGASWEAPDPFFFDATSFMLIQRLYDVDIREPSAFTTQVGRNSLDIWSAISVRVSSRDPSDMKRVPSYRAYQIVDNKITTPIRGTYSPAVAARVITDFNLMLVRLHGGVS